MSFLDTFGGTGGTGTNPLSGIGVAPGGIFGGTGGAPSGFGGGPNKLGGAAPGFVSPFDQQVVGQAAQLSGEAMTNRYAQLGLSGQGATPTSPGGPAGGIGVGNIGRGMIPGGGLGGPGDPSEPTAEQMDLGQIPTLTGGIPGEAMALLGEIQTQNLQNQGGGGGGGGGKGGGGKGGGIGSMLGPMMMMGGK